VFGYDAHLWILGGEGRSPLGVWPMGSVGEDFREGVVNKISSCSPQSLNIKNTSCSSLSS
jgi:hypothetical protein